MAKCNIFRFCVGKVRRICITDLCIKYYWSLFLQYLAEYDERRCEKKSTEQIEFKELELLKKVLFARKRS